MKSRNEQIFTKKEVEDFEPLIITNDKKRFISHSEGQKAATLSRQSFQQSCPLTVIDKESLKMIQVLRLHKAIDHTMSAAGSAVLLRSLIRPGTNLHYIQAKQEALKEIASDDKLRQALTDYVGEYSKGESALFKFFNKGLYALSPYLDLKRARRAAVNLTKTIKTAPQSESSYLNALIAHLHSYEESAIHQMMSGLIYKTFKGVKSADEVKPFTPKLKFAPCRFTKWFLAGPATLLGSYLYNKVGFGPPLSPLVSAIGFGLTGFSLFYGLIIKPVRDTGKFIEPLREKCIYDNAFSRAVDTVGMLDELLSCHHFAGELPHAATLPEVTDETSHFFEATGLKNPVIAKSETDFVPNDIHINGAKLTFISGPNSGGKTTICKSIVHNQLLAQIGCYVLAEKAAINIADMISYQAPKFDGLQDTEGRFGTELIRTRDIFYSTSPKSLVILDELAEGTTYEERLHESIGILSDFHTIGNNTVLVTHNHSLAENFMDKQIGQCLMAEFKGDNPTYKIVPGISRQSHAGRVAQKINFSKEDRREYLQENGYL